MSFENVTDNLAHGRGPLSVLTFWPQALAFFVISDLLAYWIHRLFHGSLWNFYAAHHSSTTAYRFHPTFGTGDSDFPKNDVLAQLVLPFKLMVGLGGRAPTQPETTTP